MRKLASINTSRFIARTSPLGVTILNEFKYFTRREGFLNGWSIIIPVSRRGDRNATIRRSTRNLSRESGLPRGNMYIYLSKLLPQLISPLSISLSGCLLALVLVCRKRHRAAIIALSTSLILLWVCAMPFVAKSVYGALESQYPPVYLSVIPVSDCLVVLGGAVGFPASPRVDIEIKEGTDRIYQAAKMYRNGKANKVIVAAGALVWAGKHNAEALMIRDLLVEWGVTSSDILLDYRSRNTRENALNAVKLLGEAGCQSTLLVTSAFHMPRAMASFEALGIDVFPASVDVSVVETPAYYVWNFVPDAGALNMTSRALREFAGQLVYRFRGWN